MSRKKIDWNFPSNNNGEKTGISEAGIETFKGNLFSSLAREICQNSLDARYDEKKPVHIEFELSLIKTEEILGISRLSETIDRCSDYWAKEHDKKAIQFFKTAQNLVSKKYVQVLRISDANTVGLTGADIQQNSPWQNLVKSSGVSNKGGESGGSFGIGKSAPYAVSHLRTIFYSTLDIDYNEAYQGVSKLATFLDENGETTQGKGYFGVTKDNSAVLGEMFPLGRYKRKVPGTDICILGFQDNDGWEDEILKAIIDGYLISIYEQNLTVTVGEAVLNHKTIGTFLEKYRDAIPLAFQYYEVLQDDTTQWIDLEVAGMKHISLKILSKCGYRRKILMARSNGMKIFDKDRITTSFEFVAVCILRDDVNTYFRAMENPQHTKWEHDRISDEMKERRLAKKRKTELFAILRDQVKILSQSMIVDEMDAVGAGEFIPALEEPEVSESDKEKESISDHIKGYTTLEQVQLKTNKPKNNQRVTEKELVDILDQQDGESSFDGLGESEWSLPQGKAKGNKKEKTNYPRSGGKDAATESTEKQTSIYVNPLKVRLFLADVETQLYQLTFIPDTSVSNAVVKIYYTGEQGYLSAAVKGATDRRKNKLSSTGNKISIGDITANRKVRLQFSLSSQEQFSMEVEVSGHQT